MNRKTILVMAVLMVGCSALGSALTAAALRHDRTEALDAERRHYDYVRQNPDDVLAEAPARLGQHQDDAPSRPPDTVQTANRFDVRDRAGRLRASFGMQPDSDNVGLILYGEDGGMRVLLTHQPDGSGAGLLLADEDGTPRLHLGNTGRPAWLTLRDDRGYPVWAAP